MSKEQVEVLLGHIPAVEAEFALQHIHRGQKATVQRPKVGESYPYLPLSFNQMITCGRWEPSIYGRGLV